MHGQHGLQYGSDPSLCDESDKFICYNAHLFSGYCTSQFSMSRMLMTGFQPVLETLLSQLNPNQPSNLSWSANPFSCYQPPSREPIWPHNELVNLFLHMIIQSQNQIPWTASLVSVTLWGHKSQFVYQRCT